MILSTFLGFLNYFLPGNAGPNGACALPNGQPLRKSRRKEYRQMTDDERMRFHNAIKKLKQVTFYHVFNNIN